VFDMSTNLSSDEIKRLALLARLTVPEAELETIGKDVTNILGFVDTIQSVQLGDQVATADGHTNVFREDIVHPITPAYDLIEATPLHQRSFCESTKSD